MPRSDTLAVSFTKDTVNVSTAVRQIQKPPTRFVNQLLGTENEISPATGAYTFNMKPV